MLLGGCRGLRSPARAGALIALDDLMEPVDVEGNACVDVGEAAVPALLSGEGHDAADPGPADQGAPRVTLQSQKERRGRLMGHHRQEGRRRALLPC